MELVTSKLKYLQYLLLALIGLLTFVGTAFAASQPTLTQAVVIEKGNQKHVYLKWDQPESSDYGYIVTRQKQGGPEEILTELQPAPTGNNRLSKGGMILDSSVEANIEYQYNVYTFQRDGYHFGDGTTSQKTDSRRAMAAGTTSPSISIKVDTTKAGSVLPGGTTIGSSSGLGGGCIGLGVPIPTISRGLVRCPQSYTQYVSALLEFALQIGLTLCVLVIVVSGISMIISQGNSSGVSDAKDRLTQAVIGLVVLLLIGLIIKILSV